MLVLRELRQNLSLTQKEVATKLNISRQVYANYENSINEPSLEMLSQLADFFNCSIDYIVGRENEEGRIETVTPNLPSEEQTLLDGYRQLTPAAKAKMQGYLQGLLSAPNITTIKKI